MRTWRRRSSDATFDGAAGCSAWGGSSGSFECGHGRGDCRLAGLCWRRRDRGDGIANLAKALDLGDQRGVALDAGAFVRSGLAVEVGARQIESVAIVVVSHHRSIRAGEWN